jgi:hypothetical protein
MPSHWRDNYGPSYEESTIGVVKTFEGMPEGFVQITLPQFPPKKQAEEVEQKEISEEETNDGTL